MTNSFRPVVVASLLENGEAQDALVLLDVGGWKTVPRGKSRRETKSKLRERQQVVGDGMIGRFNTASKET
jgi:hypothetical protein